MSMTHYYYSAHSAHICYANPSHSQFLPPNHQTNNFLFSLLTYQSTLSPPSNILPPLASTRRPPLLQLFGHPILHLL
ncbi:Ephrin type-A receptor 8 [Bienertia sinuspersici]